MAAIRTRLLRAGVVVVVVAVVAGLAVVGHGWWQERGRTDLERALALAPADAEQLSWTDWAGVREELDVDPGDEDAATRLLDDGFDADLTQTTALGHSAEVMAADFGFSPLTVEWELFSQSAEGAVVLLRLPDDADLEEIEVRLTGLGYETPTEQGVYAGGGDLAASIGVTPELNHLAVDEDRHLVLASDQLPYLESVVEGLDDEDVDDGVARVADEVGSPLAAALYTGDHACAKLAMSQADRDAQAEAAALVAAAGEVNPLDGFAVALAPGGDVVVAMAFETDEQARENADSRAQLASGPAPGHAGDYPDDFELGDVTAADRVVRMELDPVVDFVFSSVKDGPVLFATC